MTTTIDKPKKDPKVTVVDFNTFTDYEFIPPATFYILNAMGDYVFVHTASRAIAQEYIDSVYSKGRYKIVASKLQKTVSKLEGGGYSVTGTETRKK